MMVFPIDFYDPAGFNVKIAICRAGGFTNPIRPLSEAKTTKFWGVAFPSPIIVISAHDAVTSRCQGAHQEPESL